jgi:hypothetical protein
MERVMAARRQYEQALADARTLVDRARAALGLEIQLARQGDTNQTKILQGMRKSRQQVRAFELAWLDWQKEHPDEDPRESAPLPAQAEEARQ